MLKVGKITAYRRTRSEVASKNTTHKSTFTERYFQSKQLSKLPIKKIEPMIRLTAALHSTASVSLVNLLLFALFVFCNAEW